MRKLKFLLACLFLTSVGLVNAQSKIASGKVVYAEDGQPVIGATIGVKGVISAGTITDVNGKFSLNLPQSSQTLVVSYIGMKSQELQGEKDMIIRMESNASELDEVIVVAYGTSKKGSFTGSAAVVKADAISTGSKESLDKALVGKIAGVRIGTDNGDPGSGANIQIRGVGSISASTQPLYVVDGVPITNNGIGSLYKSTSQLTSLNNDDIESITVLKDAAAASLYGSRAANGVVLITTKKGQEGKTNITYNGEFGISQLANKNALELMSGQQFIDYYITAYENYYNYRLGNAMGTSVFSDEDIAELKTWCSDGSGATSTQWRDVIYRNAFSQNHQISLTSGTDKTKIYASLAYNDQEGIVLGSNFDRVSGRLNVDQQVNKWLKLGFKQMISFTNQKGTSDQSDQAQGIGTASPLGIMLSLDPTAKVRNDDGTINDDPYVSWSGQTENPLLYFDSEDYSYNKITNMRSLSNMDIQIQFTDYLNLVSTLGYDYIDNKEQMWWGPTSIDGESYNGLGCYYLYETKNLTHSSILNFDKAFGDHTINALAGYEMADNNLAFIYSAASNYSTTNLPELANGQPYNASSSKYGSSLMSYLASANYNYSDTYYASGSFRRDGSSRLGVDNRWANFWSLSGSWRLSKESFMEDNPLFNDFRLKASFGTNGNLPSDYYAYQGLYSTSGGYGSDAAIYWSSPANNNLGWEKSQNFNVGFQWNMFSRVNLSIEYYNKYTESLLFEIPASVVTGFSSYTTNLGNISNSGIELELGTVNVKTKDFSWETDFNFTWQKNEIVSLPDGEDIITGDGSMYLLREGESMYTFYLPVWAGVDDETGLGQFWIDPDDHSQGLTNKYTEAGSTIVGKALPDFIGGMTNTFRYKNFDLICQLSYQFGGSIFDYFGYFTHNDGYRAFSFVSMAEAADYWTPENTDAEYPAPIYGNPYRSDRFSSRIIRSSDNIRMREITLGYTIPINKFVQNARIYARTNNPFMIWSATPSIDPDVPINGYRTVDTPATRSFVFGVNFTL